MPAQSKFEGSLPPRGRVHGAIHLSERGLYKCEIMGCLPIGPEYFDCLAPDTGIMETLILYGTDEHHD